MKNILDFLYKKLIKSENREIVLSDKDYDRFLKNVHSTNKPSSKIKEAAEKLDQENFDTTKGE